LDLRAGDQQQPEYLKLNPRGVVPTLLHDGRAVRESNVILEYLDDAFPENPLRPQHPYDRAQVRLWLKRFDEGHHDIATATVSMGIAFRHQYLEQGEEKCRALIEKIPDRVKRERRRDVIYNGTAAQEFRMAVGMWVDLFRDMEAALDGGPWLVGEQYSLADAAYTKFLTRVSHLYVLSSFIFDIPSVLDWYGRIKERPSYKSAILDWTNDDYLALMKRTGEVARPSVESLIESVTLGLPAAAGS
jgi:glutathione S-transferase